MDNSFQTTNQYGGTLYNKPKDFGVKKNEKWYFDYAQYVASKYNFIIPQFGPNTLRGLSGTFTNNLSTWNNVSIRWATNALLNEAYAKAQQEDTFFDFMGQDESNNPLSTRFIKDTTPFEIYKHILGNIVKNCMSLPDTVFANSISNEALKDKDLSINMAKMKVDFSEDFDELNEAGADFAPMGGQEFNTTEDVEKYAENMQDAMASFFTAFAKDFLYSQNWEEKCTKLAEYLVPSYFCRSEIYPEGTDIKWNIYRPAQCIWDNTFDDEMGKKQRFQGIVIPYSIPDLISAYDWEKTELEELNRLASEIPTNGDTIMQLNNMNGATDLVWWGLLSRVPTVAVVKARFISWDEETQRETWFQADLIGNKWIKKYGKVDNLVLHKDGSIDPPFYDFIPELSYGVNFSIIEKMREISGLIRGLNGRINALIARAKGKVPVFLGSKFPTGVNQVTLLKQIAAGLVFVDDADIDEITNNPENKGKIADVLDLTSAITDIQMMRNEVDRWENKLRSMASTPLVQLGSQTQVIGAKVQEQTIEQSTYGMLPLYHGFMLYMNTILNGAAQMKKNIISTAEDKEKFRFQVSPRQFKYFEATKMDSLSDIQIYLSQKDQIDEADRQYIQTIADRESQNPNSWFDALDAVTLLTFNTKTEMINYLRYKKKVWEDKQQRAAQQEQMLAAQQQQANNQTQENIAETQAEASLANTALKNHGEMKNVALKSALEPLQE